MPARRHPPAWYPDPHHPGQLRRWTGSTWTADVRPFPPWLRSLKLAPGPPPRFPRGPRAAVARRLWAASTIALVSALLLLLSLTAPYRTTSRSDRVDDRDFLAAATEVCTRANEEVLQPYTPGVDSPEELATGVEQFVDELREIEVDRRDEPKVAAWLAAWDEWTAAGHRFAVARSIGDYQGAEEITAESNAVRAAINRFAYTNGLTACVLGGAR